MIHVIAIITAKSGMREDILREFRANMPAVHAEQGCIEYGPATDTPDIGKFQTPFGPDTFVVIEKWESPEALKAHADRLEQLVGRFRLDPIAGRAGAPASSRGKGEQPA